MKNLVEVVMELILFLIIIQVRDKGLEMSLSLTLKKWLKWKTVKSAEVICYSMLLLLLLYLKLLKLCLNEGDLMTELKVILMIS